MEKRRGCKERERMQKKRRGKDVEEDWAGIRGGEGEAGSKDGR